MSPHDDTAWRNVSKPTVTSFLSIVTELACFFDQNCHCGLEVFSNLKDSTIL